MIKIKKSYLICVIVLFLQLLWMQKKVFWPSLSGITYQIVYYMKYIATFVLAVYTMSRPKRNEEVIRKNIYIKQFIPLFVLYICIEMIAIICSPVVSAYGLSYWTRCTALFLDKICILVMVSCIWLLCGKHSIDCISSALIFIGFLQLFVTLVRTGVIETIQVFGIVFGLFDSNSASALLETNEYTFALGLLLIYYLFFCKKDARLIWPRIIMLAVLVIAGGKRIVFGGIIVAGIFSLLVYKRGLCQGTLTCIGIIGVVLCMTYVAMCYNGEAMEWLELHGINVMGRDTIYDYFTNQTEFAYNYCGWGLAGVSKVIENLTGADVGNMASVRGLHNDILKIYIEFGFWGGILWYSYQLVYLPRKFFSIFGKKNATIYMALILYAFITYLTDNTENYFLFQVVLWLIPLAANYGRIYDILDIKEATKRKELKND